jgi:membrane peptidoglycan carboxypeptidase
MSDNFFSDNEDIRFYFERGVDWAALVEASCWSTSCAGR